MSLQFEMKIATGNAAFGEDENQRAAEIGTILRKLAESFSDGVYAAEGTYGLLRDSNGNKVGTWTIAEEKPVSAKKPRFYYMEFASSDTVYVWQLDESSGEMKTVVLHDRLASRTAIQAARQGLVKRGLMKAPTTGQNGGWIYGDDVELFQL